MKRFKVQSGEIDEIVRAETAAEAAAYVFTMFDDDDCPPMPGEYLSTIEVVGEELWHKTEDAIKRAGRWGGIDASTAAKS